MAPISSTCACRHVSWRKSGAKHRITAAKQAGRRSMTAVLWRGHPRLADQRLRHLPHQARTSASRPPILAKAELRYPLISGMGPAGFRARALGGGWLGHEMTGCDE